MRSILSATCPRLSALVKPAAQHGPGDVHLLDVDRAASNAPAPAVAQTPFHRKLLGVAISAHQLHRIARDFARDRIGEAFRGRAVRSEEHTSELQSLMRTSYAVFCLNTNHKT